MPIAWFISNIRYVTWKWPLGRCSRRAFDNPFNYPIPSDGVDRDTGGESGHRKWIWTPAQNDPKVKRDILSRCPDPPRLTVGSLWAKKNNGNGDGNVWQSGRPRKMVSKLGSHDVIAPDRQTDTTSCGYASKSCNCAVLCPHIVFILLCQTSMCPHFAMQLPR